MVIYRVSQNDYLLKVFLCEDAFEKFPQILTIIIKSDLCESIFEVSEIGSHSSADTRVQAVAQKIQRFLVNFWDSWECRHKFFVAFVEVVELWITSEFLTKNSILMMSDKLEEIVSSFNIKCEGL